MQYIYIYIVERLRTIVGEIKEFNTGLVNWSSDVVETDSHAEKEEQPLSPRVESQSHHHCCCRW